MKLHELHVGNGDPGAVCHGIPVAGGDDRIGRVAVDLPASASREHGGIGTDLHRLAEHTRPHPGTAPVFDDQLEDTRIFQRRRPLARSHFVHESAGDLGPGAVAVRVYDTPPGMRPLFA